MAALTIVLLLVVLATAVATGARHWSLPAPSLLVVAGLLVGLVPGVPGVHVAPELISVLVLPPLLYASAEEISWRELRAVWRPVTVLALGLVLASAAAVGAVMAVLTPLPASAAFVLGAILAPTDPVAVTALGRRLSLPPRVQTIVQSESLFNDATSLVLFKVAIGTVVAAGAVSAPSAVGQFVLLGGGGAMIGAAVAAVVALIRRRTEDPVLETVISLVTPYAAYLVAEELHTSGVMAVVVAGVILGALGHRLTNAVIRLQVHAVYNTVVFLLESVVFAVIGLELPTMVQDLAADEHAWPLWVLAVTLTVLVMRLLWVFPLSALMQYRNEPGSGVSWRVPAVLCWAGTRGVVPLAAVLSIPLTTDSGDPFPHRALILTLTTGTVVVTLIAQGFTLAPLVRRSGIALEPEHTAREEDRARHRLARAALTALDQLEELGTGHQTARTQARHHLEARIRHPEHDTGETGSAGGTGDAGGAAVSGTAAGAEGGPTGTGDGRTGSYGELRRALIAAETAELQRLYEAHEISHTTRRRLQHTLDLEEAGLGD